MSKKGFIFEDDFEELEQDDLDVYGYIGEKYGVDSQTVRRDFEDRADDMNDIFNRGGY